MDKWESIAERKIREAFEAGAFDDLPCKGKPIPIETNPFEDSSLWMAHHLLRVNGFAPAWIEDGRDLDAAARRLREALPTPAAIARANIVAGSAPWRSSVSEGRN